MPVTARFHGRAQRFGALLAAVLGFSLYAQQPTSDPVARHTRVFFLDIRGGRVVSTTPDGADVKVLVPGRSGTPDGIVVDTEHGHIYWTIMGRPREDDGRIERADLDGGNLTTIVPAGGAFTPKQLELDAVHGKLYWSDREGMRVMRADLDGSNIETLVETGRGEAARSDARNWCVGIALDVAGGKVYWTQKGGDNAGVGSIRRAGLEIPKGDDAAHRSDIEVLFDGLPEPIDLELDLTRRMIYWTDRGDGPRGNTVSRAPMDPPRGVNPGSRTDQQILMRDLGEAIGIALDLQAGRLYATDLSGTIRSAGLDGSDQKVVLSGQGSLTGIAVVQVPDAPASQTPAPQPLAQTAALDWPEEDLSGRLMDGAHRFVERQVATMQARTDRFWKYDRSSAAAWTAALTGNRDRLREIIGAIDQRVAPALERFGDDENPAIVAETPRYRVLQVRWPVLDGMTAEGLLVEQIAAPSASVVAVPDAGQTPEQILGLAPGLPPERQFARVLAESGCDLLIPTLIQRALIQTDDAQLRQSQQTWREWIYRQAFHMGRHPIGFEVQKVLAAVDRFRARRGNTARIGVVGHAEGGLIAFYAAAIDTRIDGALVSGYFDRRGRVWEEPIDRNIWSLLERFGDAEIAALVLPRHLVIEHAEVPSFTSSKGAWQTPSGTSVRAEFDRIPVVPAFPKPSLVAGDGDRPVGAISTRALGDFARRLGFTLTTRTAGTLTDRRKAFDPAARHARTVVEMERYVQGLVRGAEHVRDRAFLFSVLPELTALKWSTEKSRPTWPPQKFIDGARPYRERFRTDGIGVFDAPYLPLNPRTRKVGETDKWTAWDVVLDVWPDVFAWGVIVIPKGITAGERRPVVVVQHGRNGLPRETIDRHVSYYNDFGSALADRGFIVFAPHNLYRGEDRYRWLSRKANTIRATLFSFILAQHERILDWLGSLPFVAADRIAFYGLSYGGETAVRIPAILEKYALSICSGDFNQWTRKVAATDQPFSFMRTIEWEMPYWNWGHTFDYAEMTYLIFPRPFMVERGHLDLVGRDQWVAHEYGKVQFLYAQLGLADRTEIEYFQGGHSISGQGTFAFLHKHLRWPAPR